MKREEAAALTPGERVVVMTTGIVIGGNVGIGFAAKATVTVRDDEGREVVADAKDVEKKEPKPNA